MDLKTYKQIDVLTDPGTHTFKKAEGGRWLNPVTGRFLTERGLQKMLDGYIRAGCVVLPVDPRGDKELPKKVPTPGVFTTFVMESPIIKVPDTGPSLMLVYGEHHALNRAQIHELLENSTYVDIYCIEPGMPNAVSPPKRRLAGFSYSYKNDRWALDVLHNSFRDHLFYEYNMNSSAEIFGIYSSVRPTTIIEIMRCAIEHANEINPAASDIIVKYYRD